MSTRKTLWVVLGISVLACVIAAGQTQSGIERDLPPAMEHRETVYLTVELPPNIDLVTVANPRADSGQILFITHLFTENQIQLGLPPELGDDTHYLTFPPNLESAGESMFQLRPPLPVTTVLPIGYSGSARAVPVVLYGYYARSVTIEAMQIVEGG